MITEDKVIEIFCIMDEFCNNFASECEKNLRLEDKEHPHRNRKGRLSFSEIMTILVCYISALLPISSTTISSM